MELKNKSIDNLEAADLLIQNGKYASSVHCSYYSCLQLMKYVIYKYIGKPYSMQDEETKMCGKQNRYKKSSHEYLIDEIGQSLCRRGGEVLANNVRRNFIKLKENRNISDYYNIKIDERIAKTAKDFSINIQCVLRSVYKIN